MPPPVHEVADVRVVALQLLLHEFVEVAHHLRDLGEVALRQVLEALLHALEVLLEELLLELLHQRVEVLARAAVHEVVVAEFLDASARPPRELVQLAETAVRHLPEHVGELVRRSAAPRAGLTAALSTLAVLPVAILRGAVARRPAVRRRRDRLQPLVDALALLADDAVEPLLDVVEHGGQVIAVEVALAGVAEPFEEVLQPCAALALAAHAVAHHAIKRAAQVVALQDLLGEAVEQVVGRGDRDLLRAVPS